MFSTLDEAVNEAASTLTDSVESSQEEPQEEIQAEEEASNSDESKAESQEVKQEDPKKDDWRFTDIDPKTLPPELQDVYHNLNKGFTQGMQKKSEEIKSLKAELEQLRAQYQQGTTNQPQEQDYGQKPIAQMTPEEFFAYNQKMLKEDLRIERENEYIGSAEKEFTLIDERLNQDSPKYDVYLTSAVADRLLDLRTQYEKENNTIIGFDFKGETQRIIKDFDDIMSQRYREHVAARQQQAKQQADKLSKTNLRSGNVPSSRSKKMSLEDAALAAVEKAGY